jgi:hypothetical protein
MAGPVVGLWGGVTVALLVVCACGKTQEPVTTPAESVSVAPVAAAEPPPPLPESPPPATTAVSSETAIANCIHASKVSLCLPMFGKTMDDDVSMSQGAACTSACIAAREERLAPAIDRAVSVCRGASVRGATASKCVFPKVKRPADAREVSMRFQDALRAAVDKRDAASVGALDAMLPVLDAPYLASIEPACTKRCREDDAARP